MEELVKQIEKLKADISAFNGGDAEVFRIQYLGSKGLVKSIMGEMRPRTCEAVISGTNLLNTSIIREPIGSPGPNRLQFDGQELAGNTIPLLDDGLEHSVTMHCPA